MEMVFLDNANPIKGEQLEDFDALILLAHQHFWLLSGAFTGFLLVAPVVATGLYAISRALERGQRADLSVAVAAWKPNRVQGGRLMLFGLLLACAGTPAGRAV